MREQHREVIRKEASGNQKKQDKHETVETAIITISMVKAFQNYLNRWVQHTLLAVDKR